MMKCCLSHWTWFWSPHPVDQSLDHDHQDDENDHVAIEVEIRIAFSLQIEKGQGLTWQVFGWNITCCWDMTSSLCWTLARRSLVDRWSSSRGRRISYKSLQLKLTIFYKMPWLYADSPPEVIRYCKIKCQPACICHKGVFLHERWDQVVKGCGPLWKGLQVWAVMASRYI